MNVVNAQYDIGCLNESVTTSDTCEEDQPPLQSSTTSCKAHSDSPINDCNTVPRPVNDFNTGPVLRRSKRNERKRNVRITSNNDNTPEKQFKKRLLQDSNEPENMTTKVNNNNNNAL